MIRAIVQDAYGQTLVCGLTHNNLDRLAANQPIRFRVLPWVPLDIWILGAPDRRSIAEDLRALGVTATLEPGNGDGLVRSRCQFHYGRPAGSRGPVLDVLALGITTAADQQLRAGATLSTATTGGLRVKLLAGPDTDTLDETITAGMPVENRVDLRGGRID